MKHLSFTLSLLLIGTGAAQAYPTEPAPGDLLRLLDSAAHSPLVIADEDGVCVPPVTALLGLESAAGGTPAEVENCAREVAPTPRG